MDGHDLVTTESHRKPWVGATVHVKSFWSMMIVKIVILFFGFWSKIVNCSYLVFWRSSFLGIYVLLSQAAIPQYFDLFFKILVGKKRGTSTENNGKSIISWFILSGNGPPRSAGTGPLTFSNRNIYWRVSDLHVKSFSDCSIALWIGPQWQRSPQKEIAQTSKTSRAGPVFFLHQLHPCNIWQ
jgi:hypothetical protein